MENITDSDYNHPERICKDFEITNLDLYQDLHLTLFIIGFFGAGHGCWRGESDSKKAPFFKIRHTCPKNETCLKKIQNIYKSRDIPLAFCWHQHFLTELCILCFIKKYRHRLYFGTIPNYESLKIILISMVKTLMMSEKMATLGYSKI